MDRVRNSRVVGGKGNVYLERVKQYESNEPKAPARGAGAGQTNNEKLTVEADCLIWSTGGRPFPDGSDSDGAYSTAIRARTCSSTT